MAELGAPGAGHRALKDAPLVRKGEAWEEPCPDCPRGRATSKEGALPRGTPRPGQHSAPALPGVAAALTHVGRAGGHPRERGDAFGNGYGASELGSGSRLRLSPGSAAPTSSSLVTT